MDFERTKLFEILEFCFANDILLCRIPCHASHKLQLCDGSVFGPLTWPTTISWKDSSEAASAPSAKSISPIFTARPEGSADITQHTRWMDCSRPFPYEPRKGSLAINRSPIVRKIKQFQPKPL